MSIEQDLNTVRDWIVLYPSGITEDNALAALSRIEAENDRLRALLASQADFLKRLSEWDMLCTTDGGAVVADGPYWKTEIAKAHQALKEVER